MVIVGSEPELEEETINIGSFNVTEAHVSYPFSLFSFIILPLSFALLDSIPLFVITFLLFILDSQFILDLENSSVDVETWYQVFVR